MKICYLLLLLITTYLPAFAHSFNQKTDPVFLNHQDSILKKNKRVSDINPFEEVISNNPPLRLDSTEQYSMGKFSELKKYEYHPTNQLSDVHFFATSSDGSLAKTRRDEYKYNQDGSLSEWIEYSITNDGENKKNYKLFDYPDGGKRIRSFGVRNGIFEETDCEWTDKHGLVISDIWKNEGFVDEANFRYIKNSYTYNSWENPQKTLSQSDTCIYISDWSKVIKLSSVSFLKTGTGTSIPNYMDVFLYDESGLIYQKEYYTYNQNNNKWEGVSSEYKTYHKTTGSDKYHLGQTKENILYRFENNSWLIDTHTRTDKLNNILYSNNQGVVEVSEFNFSLLPDGMRISKQNPNDPESIEIIQTNAEGYPLIFIKGGEEFPFSEHVVQTLPGGAYRDEYICPVYEEGIAVLLTLTFVTDSQSRIISFEASLDKEHNDPFYKLKKDYSYSGDTICLTAYYTNPETPVYIKKFSSDHFIYSTCYFDYQQSQKAEYYVYNTYDRNTNSSEYMINYGERPNKMKVEYDSSNRLLYDELHSGNKALNPSDSQFWSLDGYSEYSYNDMGYRTRYFSNWSNYETLTEQKYHTSYPSLLTEESNKNWYNSNIQSDKKTIYHHSEWASVSDNKISVPAKIKLLRLDNKIILSGPENETGRWYLINTDGRCLMNGELNNGCTEVPMNNLLKGVYILRIATNEYTQTEKFIY